MPTDQNDDRILEMIAASFEAIEPAPADAVQAAVDAFAFRDLDSRLAELTFDSWAAEPAVAMRGPRTDARLLSFEFGELSLDVELGSGATLVGQIVPAVEGAVEIESPSGVTLSVVPDEHGRFRVLSLPAGNVRVRMASGVRTPWIVR
jgi:hypothetical protein